MDQHIGKLLRKKAVESGMLLSKLAKKMGISRGQLYRIFNQKRPKTRHIMRMGAVIHYDFKQDFPEIAEEASEFEVEESSFPYRSEQKEQLLKCYSKYTKLLEAHNYLLGFIVRLVKQGKLSEKEMKELIDEKITLYKGGEN